MSTKQERAWQRLQEREFNQRISRELDDAAKSWVKEPDSALALLYSQDLFPLLLADFGRAGLVGEKRNALAVWVVATSRLRDKPLNVLIKGRSSSGKNHLARTVLKFFPPTEVVQASSLSQRSMNYVGRDALSHRIFYVDELRSTSGNHPARQLISEGRIVHRVTRNKNGAWITEEVVTEGPVACVTTTTADVLAIDDESRNLSIWIDESYAQTKAISKAVVEANAPSLHPQRLALWHAVQALIAKIRDVPIATPAWFELLVEKILPYGDLRIRRYWPAFIEATKVICMVRNARIGEAEIERQKGLVVSFRDFAITTHIFDKIIGQSLTRSATDEEVTTAELVQTLMAESLNGSGISAGDLVGQPGIQSLDKAYTRLRRAANAGTIIQVNPPGKNNEKRYIRSPAATFLGDPVAIHAKLGLRMAGAYVHPINGKYRHYGK